ncbi:hypothetical protein [Gaiella sp.]|jgi:hypothetical protein|uniref:hypothetical protein n=1 Tax=Gaiella sp. TaxID=2663207 RepID=UPI002C1D47DD|nr:hypothetical protein [Gaiella sp.]HWO81595.1 hypothetical protein [Gaiella sp.]
MRNRTRTAIVAVAALAALALAAVATAAYTSPKLSVSYAAGNVTRIVASASVDNDATARAAIVIPTGTALTTTAAPGTKVGTAKAQVSALALGGALLPLAGDIVVAPPGSVPAASQTGCIGPATPQATLMLVLQAAGQTINLPAYIIPTSGPQAALGAAQLVFCLPPPDLPAPVGATFGAKFLSADLTLNGVIGPIAQGAWVAFWTPWNAGVGTVNAAATVASPAAIAPGGITLSGRKVKGVKRLSGRVTQAGAGVATKVTILAGTKRLATVSARANGAFTYAVPKKSKATTFRARAVVAGHDAPAVCGQFGSLGVPCVNATVSGFTATSGAVRIR